MTDAWADATPRRERLARRRKTLGLTQEALAELLGVERSTVMRWEHGDTEPLPSMRPRLAKALRVSADRLQELLSSDGGRGTGAEPGTVRDRVTRSACHPNASRQARKRRRPCTAACLPISGC
jgi:transcriptional regulator with XRE-family HTH domain